MSLYCWNLHICLALQQIRILHLKSSIFPLLQLSLCRVKSQVSQLSRLRRGPTFGQIPGTAGPRHQQKHDMVRSFCAMNHVVTPHASSPTAAKQNCICACLGPVGPSWSFNAEYLWVSLSQGLNHWTLVELATNHAWFLALYVGYITFHHRSCCFLLCCWHQALMSVNFISIFGTFSS